MKITNLKRMARKERTKKLKKALIQRKIPGRIPKVKGEQPLKRKKKNRMQKKQPKWMIKMAERPSSHRNEPKRLLSHQEHLESKHSERRKTVLLAVSRWRLVAWAMMKNMMRFFQEWQHNYKNHYGIRKLKREELTQTQ